MVKCLDCTKLGFPYPYLLLEPAGAALQPGLVAAWLERGGGSQMKDSGELSMLVPPTVEAKQSVVSLAHQP